MAKEGNAAVGKRHPNTLNPYVVYKIHPAIGIARLGKADEFFIGPELPGRGSTGKHSGVGTDVPSAATPSSAASFKVPSPPPASLPGPPVPGAPAPTALAGGAGGKIKRQAARFRIWEYTYRPDKALYFPTQEINLSTPGIKKIKWIVKLANRKSSFYRFKGTNGEQPPYGLNPDFKGSTTDKRNSAEVGDNARSTKFDIDPDAQSIEMLRGGAIPPKKEIISSKGTIPANCRRLGELQTDSKGRLLVLGGRGNSESLPPGQPLDAYANNVGWFDDISDGWVAAELEFDASEKSVPADNIEAAWVLVGPPDFAPPIGNIITLYEAISDVIVQYVDLPEDNAVFLENRDYATDRGLRRLALMKKGFKTDLSTGPVSSYKPSFYKDIYPIVERLQSYRWVHGNVHPFHSGFTPTSSAKYNPANMGNPAGSKAERGALFKRLRVPDGMTAPTDPEATGGTQNMPRLLGDEEIDDTSRILTSPGVGRKKEFLSMTGLQYFLLAQWLKGNFETDARRRVWTDPETDASPELLDEAALENSAGGAFFPGIEVGWLIRNPEIYKYGVPSDKIECATSFRIQPWKRDPATGKILTTGGSLSRGGTPVPKEIPYGSGPDMKLLKLEPGYFSQQMAQPWQADFLSCVNSPHGGADYGWWPAQRPDDVFVDAADVPGGSVEWTRGITAATPSAMRQLLIDFLDTRGFVVQDGANYLEKDGLPKNPPPLVAPPVGPLVVRPPSTSCFIASAAFGSPFAPEVQFLREIRDNVLREMDWGRKFFDEYWKHYYRISPAIAEEMQSDPELQKTIRWSIVEPWTYYMKLLVSRPDWNRVDFGKLDPSLAEFLTQLRKDMDTWLSIIEMPRGYSHLDPIEAARELNVILTYVRRTGGLEYLDELLERGELPLRYEADQEASLVTLFHQSGRSADEIQRILYGRR